MLEIAKIVGAVAWVAGLLLLLLSPALGWLVLFVAVVISISTATRTRQQRHKELLEAVRNR